MKRTRLNSDPEKQRAWQERSRRKHFDALRRGSQLKRKARLNPRNAKRRKARYQKCFGEKSEWMREAYPCCALTGKAGSDFLPIDHAHVLGTRGAGADSSGIIPLWRPVHVDFDGSMTDARFEAKWGKSREWVRIRTREIHAEWEAR
jgi:hypothetical protein